MTLTTTTQCTNCEKLFEEGEEPIHIKRGQVHEDCALEIENYSREQTHLWAEYCDGDRTEEKTIGPHHDDTDGAFTFKWHAQTGVGPGYAEVNSERYEAIYRYIDGLCGDLSFSEKARKTEKLLHEADIPFVRVWTPTANVCAQTSAIYVHKTDSIKTKSVLERA